MAQHNSRLMKLFWLVEDGADADAVLNFLTRTGKRGFSRSERREERPSRTEANEE